MTTAVQNTKPWAKADPSSDVYRSESHPLDPLFSPRSVAVIGATERMGSVGRSVLWNLLSSPFGGTVFPVNSKRPSVLGIKAYPVLQSCPTRWTWWWSPHRPTPCPTSLRNRLRRHSGGHRNLSRLQGVGRARQGAGSGDLRDHSRQDAADRAELPGRDESHPRPERDLRAYRRAARQCGVHQPERRAVSPPCSTGACARMSASAPSSPSAPCST